MNTPSQLNFETSQVAGRVTQPVIVPVCQREGCDKPLTNPNEISYLWVREHRSDKGRQAVFCADCAAEIRGHDNATSAAAAAQTSPDTHDEQS